MIPMLENSLTRAVGIALLHSLWQILLVAAVLALLTPFMKRWTANSRYLVAYTSLLVVLFLPVVTLVLAYQGGASGVEWSANDARQTPRPLSSEARLAQPVSRSDRDATLEYEQTLPGREDLVRESREARAGAASTFFSKVITALGTQGRLLPWLTIIWSYGVVAFSLRPLLAMHRCFEMRRTAEVVQAPWIRVAMVELCDRVGLRRVIQVASSKLIETPSVIGVVSPIVLLPASLLTGQSPEELKAILAHELAHVRRHDFVMNLIQTAIETLLFYHPAVWWISSITRQERENCCDDIALGICGRKNYAKALASLELVRSGNAGLAMAASGGSLYHRIHRIVRPGEVPNSPSEAHQPLGGGLALFIAVLPILVALVAVRQDPVAAADQNGQAQGNIQQQPGSTSGVPNFGNGKHEPASSHDLQMELELAESDVRSSQGSYEWVQGYYDYIVKKHQADEADQKQITKAKTLRDESHMRLKRHRAILAHLRDRISKNLVDRSSNDEFVSDGRPHPANPRELQTELKLAEDDITASQRNLERRQEYFDLSEKLYQAGKVGRVHLTSAQASRDKARFALNRHLAIFAHLRSGVSENRGNSSSVDN